MVPRGGAGQFDRDPVSELFDGAARQLLTRAYDRQGQWVSTRIANPLARHVAWAASMGINLLGPDPVQTLGGSHIDARSAWARGFIRAVYYQHRWHYRTGHGLTEQRRVTPNRALAVRFRVGRLLPPQGRIPGGRQVSIIALPGGQAARRAVQDMPDNERIFTDDGRHGGSSADPEANG